MDTRQIRVRGSWVIQYLTLSGDESARAWERGDRTYTPIDITFADAAGPVREDAAEVTSEYTVTETVRPSAYRVDRNTVAFAGRGAHVGAVSFEGRFLNPGRTEFGEGEEVVVGTLRVNGRTFPNMRFSVAAD